MNHPADASSDKRIVTHFTPAVPAVPERVTCLPELIRRDSQAALLRVSDLERDESQPRKLLEGIDELANSILAHGLINAVLVRQKPDEPGKYLVVAGERRWRAHQHAGLDMIPARILDRELQDRERRALQFAENNDRAGLNLIEEGLFFQEEKQARACSNRELAKALGVDKSYVDLRIRLLSLPAPVQERIRSGQIDSPSAAYRLTKITSDEDLHQAVEGLVAGTLTPTALRSGSTEKKAGPTKRKQCTIAGVTITVSSSKRITYAQWKEALEQFIARELDADARMSKKVA